jgi:anaerobic nitric oxide reductase transcription regulator
MEPFYGNGSADILADPDSPAARTVAGAEHVSLRAATEEFQRLTIRKALADAMHNWAQAARTLELDPSNLHKLARKLGLK